MKRTRPYFVNQDGTTKHWPRYDGVYRTKNLQLMWLVVDTEVEYLILRLDARDATAKPKIETSIPYSDNAFSIACQMAQRMADDATRADAKERALSRV